MSTFADRVAWITGGGTGVGEATAHAFAEAGATVVVSGRRENLVEAVVQAIRDRGGSAEGEPLDVSDSAAVARVGAAIVERHGRVDTLVNCAGVNSSIRRWHQLTPDEWDRVLRVNLNGCFYTTHAVLPAMRERRAGTLIHVASWMGRHFHWLGGAAYSASKHALATMSETLNMEEVVNGIRSCVIYPAEIATTILNMRTVPPSNEAAALMLKPEDVARVIRFVAESPPHVCLNEIVVSPTWNRIYLGGRELVREYPQL
jgi:NADP-dependent 3-hydroxy acid dehydrogenase YdfG